MRMRNNVLFKKGAATFDYSKFTKVYKDQALPPEGELFTDPLFPPNFNSLLALDKNNYAIDNIDGVQKANLIDYNSVEWMRAGDMFPKPHIFEKSVSVDNVIQGQIGISYFLSAVAALCQHPGLITQIFLEKEVNTCGIYKILLWIDGEFQIVLVDDYFPVVKGTNISFFSKPNSFEIWLLLLEKAWAKVNGGYANIISGWPSDVFRAVTGFGCEQLLHKYCKVDHLWGIVSTVDSAKGAMCVIASNDDEVIKKGLIKNHVYTLMKCQEIEMENGRKVQLCLLRNPWGKKEWNGDWNDESALWTDKIKEQIENFNEKDDGSFWISVDDMSNYFIRTDVCQVIYGSKVQIINYKQADLKFPQVLNIYVDQQGMFSASVMEKNWRFNRAMRNQAHPTSLILAEYDPRMKTIKHAFTDFEAYQDAEKSRILNPGYYILWFYKPLDLCKDGPPEWTKLKLASSSTFRVKQLGPDKEFKVIKEIIGQSVKNKNRANIKPDEVFYDISNSFKNSGIAYRAIINPMGTCYQKWENEPKLEGLKIHPPYNDNKKFDFEVPPHGTVVVTAMKKDVYGSFHFNIESKIKQFECREGEEPVKYERFEFDEFCKDDIHTIEPVIDYTTASFDEIYKVEYYPIVDHKKMQIESLMNRYPVVMKQLLEMTPPENDDKLSWNVVDMWNALYVGQLNYITREGRGSYFFKEEGTTWIGYWNNGQKGKFGKFYGMNNRVVYEGEYEKGMRNGKGKQFFTSGEKYEGEFVDNKRQGKGTFYWNDGSRWEGTFKDDEMDGEGIYYEGKQSIPAKYKNGSLVE